MSIGAPERAPAVAPRGTPAGIAWPALRRRGRLLALRIGTFLVPLALWWCARRFDWIDVGVLPPLGEVLDEAVAVIGTATFREAIASTLQTALLGLAVSMAIGIPVGILIGRSGFAQRSTRLLLDVLRSFPFIGLLPLIILIMGTGTSFQITLVTLACVWPLILQSSYGSRHIDGVMSDTMRSYRIGRRLWIAKVVIPHALPYIGTGLRIAITMALLVTIGVETIVQVPGIGYEIAAAQRDGAIPEMYAYIGFAALVGVAVNLAALRVEGMLLRWRPPSDGGAS